MEQLYVFGTGNAAVTRCYNTCFAVKKDGEYLMTDAGGGNGILGILEDMDVDLCRIHHIIVTHAHTDHILGIVWMVRFIGTAILNGRYEGELNLYCQESLVSVIDTLCKLTLQGKLYRLLGTSIRFVPVKDGDELTILSSSVTFFDIHSTKAPQFGFTMLLENGKKLTCCGDEPYNQACEAYVKGSHWLLHEAFCLYRDRERFKPYEKHHSTVKDACQLAEQMGVSNLVLWHTEDKNIQHRKQLYTEEGQAYFHGRILVPEDKEILYLGD